MQVIQKIKDAGDTLFSITWIKKDGSERSALCRSAVQKYCNGNGLKYDPLEKGLLPLFDIKKDGHIMVTINTVKRIKIRGVEYKVD